MPKHERARSKPGAATAGGAATGVAFESVIEATSSGAAIEHEKIARLAYSHWEARGCPHGSPDEDWFRAERELRGNPSHH
jgi:hypothetical protein